MITIILVTIIVIRNFHTVPSLIMTSLNEKSLPVYGDLRFERHSGGKLPEGLLKNKKIKN